jgi:carboxyl-terminal processing protease
MSIRTAALYMGILSLLGLAFGVGYISYPLLHITPEERSVLPAPAESAPPPAADDAQNMALYWEAMGLLERDFLGPKPDATARAYGAIRGMVQSFNDPYTFFMEPQPRELERDDLAGRFGGIGAGLELTPEGYRLQPATEQPAAAAGVLTGDLLLMVDDREITAAMPQDDVISLVRGPVGSVVTLLIRRTPADGAADQELTIAITRAEIQTPSVEWELRADSPSGTVGYIRHTLFTERSADEMQQALTELAAAGATRYVLDLRGNRGGLVTSAIAIADLWLDEGAILIEQRADGSETVQSATAGMLLDAPLAVIVDGGSASAAEIVAGALQDHGRALLVGEKSFGKGSVQLIHELSDQSSLHVTYAEWLTPSRRKLTGNGLLPDIAVAAGEDPLPRAIAVVEATPVAQVVPAAGQ